MMSTYLQQDEEGVFGEVTAVLPLLPSFRSLNMTYEGPGGGHCVRAIVLFFNPFPAFVMFLTS